MPGRKSRLRVACFAKRRSAAARDQPRLRNPFLPHHPTNARNEVVALSNPLFSDGGPRREPLPGQPGAVPENAKYYTGIDWASLFFRLLENIHWLLLAALLSSVAAGLYVKYAVTPIYQATSKLYIAGSENTISLSDIQLGSSLATDYQEAFKIWHVHEMVDQRLGLDYSYGKLSSMVSVSNPSGSHLLYINIKSSDPQEAKLLADTYAEVVQEFISEKMELRRPQLLAVAQLPSSPVLPDLKASVIRAFLLGGALAAAVVVFLYLLDDKIRTAEDVERASGLATLGLVSHQEQANSHLSVPESALSAVPPHTAVICRDLALDYSGDEAVNTICSAILFAGRSIRRVAVTSHDANNGKSFIAIRIASSMAKRGKRVLLIDADLRKSATASQYRIKHIRMGLAHLLSGQCAAEDAVYATNLPNLYLLPVGETVKTPLPLLTSPDFEQLMDRVGKDFDLVVVDTPPVGIVIDAAEIAKHCDGILLVLEHNRQTKGSLRYMQKTMEQTQTPILGCVINNAVFKKLYQKRYYYQYGGSYEQYADGSGGSGKRKKPAAGHGRRGK